VRRIVAILILTLFGFVCQADSFLIFEENGKVGIKNQKGDVLVPAAFEALGWSDGSFSVIGDVTGYRLNNHWGILNLKKEFITQATFESLTYAGAEYVIARKKINPALTKAGCLNLRGEIKIPFQYDGISIHGLRAIVFNLNNASYHYGLTDLENRLIIPVVYKRIHPLGTLRYAVENELGKIALYREDGRAVTDFKIDSIADFDKSRAIIYQNLNQGLLDRDGNIMIDPAYQSIKLLYGDRAKVLAHHQWFLLSERNQVQRSLMADDLIPVDGKTIYRYSNKFGILDSSMSVVLPAQYDDIKSIQHDQLLARKGNKVGIIDYKNNIIIPLVYDSLRVENYNVLVLRKTEGWFLTNRKQTFRSPKNYQQIENQQAGIYPVKNNGYWGALNQWGAETIHCVFDSLLEISAKQVVVKFKDQYGIISIMEDWLVPPQPHPLILVNDSCYLQLEPQNKFLKSIKGEVIYFTDNPFSLKKDYWEEYLPDGTLKTLDYQGRLLSRVDPPPLDKLEEIFPEREGMRGIKRDGKYGFIDSRGRLRIANRYDGIGEFHEGLAPVKLIGKWGFLNHQDQIVINPNFESVESFSQGFSIVKKNGKTGVINKAGKYVLNPQYDSITHQANMKLRIHQQGLIGLADKDGSILIEPRFQELQELENGFVIVGRDGKYGLISIGGLSAIPLIYDALSFDSTRNQYLALKKSDWKEIILEN
jgi:hypothetical protein